MSLLENIKKCVTRRHGLQRRLTKVLFNVKISESFKSPNVPSQLRNLLVYIARDGVAVTDLFRRPGNPQDMKKIIADLESGRPINWTDYNFYTLANIAKRYLLHINGGILGPEAEEFLMDMLDSPDDQARIEAMHSVIVSQPKPVQQLLALLFGIWFRMIYHTEVNAMSVEAVAKSVAGSIFPTCTTSPQKVERASKVMEYLITGFASADLFSRELIQYFTSETKTSISRVEKFKYEFRFPKDVPREKSVRLFMRLLLEEGKKHGFHLIRDAVSKDVFENTNWEATCSRNTNVKKVSCSSETSRLADNSSYSCDCAITQSGGVCDDPRHRSPRHHAYSGPAQAVNAPGVTVMQAKSSVTSTPILPRRGSIQTTDTMHQQPVILSAASPDSSNNAIQQLSEKRTCVTTTPLRPYHLPDSKPQTLDFPPSKATSGQTSPFRFRVPDQPARQTNGEQLQTKTLARHATPQIACFNSVKRRQLERLQKRSDWFLSPPAGLRSTGLMHLDPNAPRAVAPVTKERPSVAPISSSGYGSVQQTSLSDFDMYPTESSHLGSSSNALMDEVDLERASSEDCIETTDDEEIDRLLLLDHGRFWGPEKSRVPSGREAGPVLESRTGSTNRLRVLDDCQISRPLTSCKPSVEEKENFPEVEIRYYVVERYYGPEPKPASILQFPERQCVECTSNAQRSSARPNQS
ncbi:hypothetical protein CSKR_202751 [Clonorchis sinensis]|uniref:Rho-GAP domain-containing protein n=1 Tax=Clonorchis sinensis TaxID=79923 RepID=A0A8T1M2I2_CLOSI|nr:hypothetical protein CSKR_202751 [Clonorchis sinensis]